MQYDRRAARLPSIDEASCGVRAVRVRRRRMPRGLAAGREGAVYGGSFYEIFMNIRK